ncbi:MAG: hypothetical protein DRP89_01185 [Candidatus Neomarinimicrobiota bacterium]|nr:MAG: hypothetical protein DRP89_01185 [Candidatus Neomarinimicrobiota bacterium]
MIRRIKIFCIIALVLSLFSCKDCITEPSEDDKFDLRNITRNEAEIESNADIDIDSEGNVHIIYQNSGPANSPTFHTNPSDIYYIYNMNKGKWSKPVNISNSDNISYDPHMVMDSKDNIHVVWRELGTGEGRTFYNMKHSDGDWKEPIPLTDDNGDQPRIDVDGFDNVHVVAATTTDSKPEFLHLVKFNDIWNITIVDHYISNHSLFVTQNGGAHLAFEYGRSIAYNHNNYDNKWNEAELLTTTSDYLKYPWVHDIAVSDEGNVYVIWCEAHTNQIKFRIKYTESTWSETDSIPNMEGDPWYPKIAVDENGLHVVWIAYTKEWDYDVYYQKLSHNGIWSERQQISLTETASLITAIKLKDNVLHIVWHEKYGSASSSERDVFYTTILTN